MPAAIRQMGLEALRFWVVCLSVLVYVHSSGRLAVNF